MTDLIAVIAHLKTVTRHTVAAIRHRAIVEASIRINTIPIIAGLNP